MGYSFLQNAFTCDYEVSGAKFKLFVIEESDSARCDEVLRNYATAVKSPQTRVAQGLLTFEDPHHGTVGLLWRGKFIWGVLGLDRADLRTEYLDRIRAASEQKLTIERLHSDPNLNGPRLREVKFSPDGSRVTFLKSRPEEQKRYDLWEYSLADSALRLLVDSRSLLPGDERLSDEERARRERKRLFAAGIAEYSWSDDGRMLLFPLGGEVYTYDLSSPPERATKRLTSTPEFETDAQFSPRGRYVSFIREQDLFVIDLGTGKERQLTLDGEGPIRNGMAEFIAQEEMGRHTGYWWSEDEKYVAFTRTDETKVQLSRRMEIYADTFEVFDQRYPRTGTPNVLIKLGVVELASGKIRWIGLGEEQDIYLARVDWLPDNRRLAIQRQSRGQKSLDLLFADALSGKARVVLSESSQTWIHLHDDLKFLKTRPQFIWASERDGHKHLYLYALDGALLRALTAGNWDVGELRGVDEEAGLIYFDGSLTSPLENHLYITSMTSEQVTPPERLTLAEGWHTPDVEEHCRFFVDHFSSPDTPPQVSLNRMDGSRIVYLEENALDENHPYYPYLADHRPAEFGSIRAGNGLVLYFRLTKPASFDPTRKYPVLVNVYGGPGGQVVRKSWRGQGDLWSQYMVQQGYVVFALDGRGSANRGRAFGDVLYRSFGSVEVEDQVRGVEFLKSLPYVDGERIGIYGHSYGGYVVLMAMMKAPGVFAAGVSSAPVTDWLLYDTHYTERYLGHPEHDPEAYRKSSVFSHLDGLEGELLVIHGMADDNVLFTNSCKLYKALQDRGVAFGMMNYPGSKHSLWGKEVATHVGKTKARFFDENLRADR
ncbi:MAG: S9 family peptidase [Candidatus Eiseniibacteriota bacterium]|nr:MAG: S9 family peptidase [Candidatus Eisenbacteria bacterium]